MDLSCIFGVFLVASNILLFLYFYTDIVSTVFIEKTNSRGKYTCYLLRETYREDGKIRHRTITNLSVCSEEDYLDLRIQHLHRSTNALVG